MNSRILRVNYSQLSRLLGNLLVPKIPSQGFSPRTELPFMSAKPIEALVLSLARDLCH